MDRFVLIRIKDVQRFTPSLFLAAGNLTKIENSFLKKLHTADARHLHVSDKQIAYLHAQVAEAIVGSCETRAFEFSLLEDQGHYLKHALLVIDYEDMWFKRVSHNYCPINL